MAAPSWVSANLAYLKELDYIETRMSSLTKQVPFERPEKDLESKPKAKPKAKAEEISKLKFYRDVNVSKSLPFT